MLVSELGAAYVVSGGQTMNPSAEDFLNAINALPNDEIILMPNNKNIVLAAQQAAALAMGKFVRVVPTRTIPQGVAAMLAYVNLKEELDFEALADEMAAAANGVRTAEVTTATRSITLDNVTAQEGQVIGLLEGKLSASGESLDAVVDMLLQGANIHRAELVTLYFGMDVREQQALRLVDALRVQYDHIEFQVVRGGQPLYPYLISIE
jgi:dihydroxyacetone kinase-like predicted kinase